MPFKKSAPSLEESCLKKIAAHYDDIRSHLIRFPDALMKKIYRHIVDGKHRDRLHLDDFIRPGATSLDLTYVPTREVADKIIRVCTNLTDLDVSRLQVPSECVITLTKHLPNLRRLNLAKNRGITDLVLAEIVASNVKLEYLNICETNVTVNGCLQLVENLPFLKKLEFHRDMWIGLFKLLKQNFNRNETCRTYSLEDVQLEEWTFDDPTLVTRMFPNLRNIAVYPLPDFESEYELNSYNCFNNIVVPILSKTMVRLTSLKLLRIGPVNLERIAIFCPMLESLHLSYCSISVKTSDNLKSASNRLPFRRLRELEIHQAPQDPHTELTLITEQDLRMLLLNSINLQSLFLLHCESFSNSFITELIELNVLQNLRKLTIMMSFSISSATVLKLLAMKNSLNYLHVACCPSIDAESWDRIENYIQSENLDLELLHSDMFPYVAATQT